MKALFLLSFLMIAAANDSSPSGYDNYSYADTPEYTNSYDTGYDYNDASSNDGGN